MLCLHEKINKNILISTGQYDCQQVENSHAFIFHNVVIDLGNRTPVSCWSKNMVPFYSSLLVYLFLQRQAAQQEHKQWQRDHERRWRWTMWPSSWLPTWSVHIQNDQSAVRLITQKSEQTKLSVFKPLWIILGSCCDLRLHECKPHNRGLNNKCYDDCMCEEGGW